MRTLNSRWRPFLCALPVVITLLFLHALAKAQPPAQPDAQPAAATIPLTAPQTAPQAAPMPISTQATKAREYDPTTPAPSATLLNIPAAELRTLLWEVRAKSGDNVLYLFGTIHVGKKNFYPLPPHVDAALRQSAVLVVEANISDGRDGAEIAKLIELPKGESIERTISPALLARLKTQLAAQKIPYANVATMRPVMLGGLLPIFDFLRLGFEMNQGLDLRLIERAQGENMPVLELESALEQVKLLTGMPPVLQEAFLENAISALEQGKTAQQVIGIVNAWQVGDAGLLERLAQKAAKDGRLVSQLNDILINNRHPAMLTKIERYFASGKKHFVAVGSLHLVGSEGLVAQLSARGYQVKQL